ncbi:hypothetical protein [Streptococcus lutetiensis]|uniref:hypothetical protein n=1 Tax=Streptococcus lutetiensis TaxID=150055 RepID=UPI001BD9B6A3|nr:hypothetical protein [Streptococcus lutetiensis]MBT0932904.1 hypothetical protein [Streptococcus lutetiensis]
MNESIKQFLEFRKKFTKREWFELNRAVEAQLSKKADLIILDDLDIIEIENNYSFWNKD